MENRSYKHWLVVAMMCCLAAGAIGICTNATGVFYTPVSESLGVLRGSFAMHATLQSLAMAVVTLYIPKIMDRLNYRRVLLAGVILSIVTTALMGISSSLWMFYLLGILRGIGICCRSGRTAIVDTLFLRTGKLLYCICKDRFSDKCRKFFFDTDRISL